MRYAGESGRAIRRVALVPGSGAGYIAAAAASADVLVTGDIKYHQWLQAGDLGLALVDLPHDVSELSALADWLPRLDHELEAYEVRTVMSRAATGAWQTTGPIKADNISDEEENSMHQLHVDGGARGNPGPAGIGAVLTDAGGDDGRHARGLYRRSNQQCRRVPGNDLGT